MNMNERIAQLSMIKYVKYETGNIGIITNGGGLALATIDHLSAKGGKAANFMDLGGQAYHEKVTESLIMMQKDQLVDVILLNMFCGQLIADKIAVVIKEAYNKGYCKKPLICRLKGAGAEEANKIIRSISSDKITCAVEFEEAVDKVLEVQKTAEKPQRSRYNIDPMA